MKIRQYITELATLGRHYFTNDELKARFLDTSQKALWASLNRLKKKRRVVTPYRGFYLIIPPEYRVLGCLPPEQFIPDLMKYLNRPYYVALLSAAEYYGSAHQRPQTFQVMTSKNYPIIRCGQVKVKFIARKNIERIPVKIFNTSTGTIRVSSPEATAMDLICYVNQSGGLNRVFTILAELAEVINPEHLCKIAKMSDETAWIRRLGYLFDQLNQKQLAAVLADSIQGKKLRTITLSSNVPVKRAYRDPLWKIIVDVKLEGDL